VSGVAEDSILDPLGSAAPFKDLENSTFLVNFLRSSFLRAKQLFKYFP
jgi:hypothetical protein